MAVTDQSDFQGSITFACNYSWPSCWLTVSLSEQNFSWIGSSPNIGYLWRTNFIVIACINAVHEKLSVTSLQSATDFHDVMRQYRILEAAKNILANKLRTESNALFCRSLLQNFTRISDTVPSYPCAASCAQGWSQGTSGLSWPCADRHNGRTTMQYPAEFHLRSEQDNLTNLWYR